MNDRGLPSQQGRFRGWSGLDAWTTVHRFFNLCFQAGDAILQPFKLSNCELVVLSALAHAGGALPVGQITRATLFETDRLRRAVDKLEARGLVTRLHQQKDRRKVFVRMEETGQRLLDSTAPAMLELVRDIMDALGTQHREHLETPDTTGVRVQGQCRLPLTCRCLGRLAARPPGGWRRGCVSPSGPIT